MQLQQQLHQSGEIGVMILPGGIGELLKIQPGGIGEQQIGEQQIGEQQQKIQTTEIGGLRRTQPGWIGKLHILCQMKTGILSWTHGSTVATTKTIQSTGGQFEADSGLLRKVSTPG